MSEPELEDLLRSLAPQVLGILLRRFPAIRAHLLEREGEEPAARADYLEAARLTSSDPERRYLLQRAARVDRIGDGS